MLSVSIINFQGETGKQGPVGPAGPPGIQVSTFTQLLYFNTNLSCLHFSISILYNCTRLLCYISEALVLHLHLSDSHLLERLLERFLFSENNLSPNLLILILDVCDQLKDSVLLYGLIEYDVKH